MSEAGPFAGLGSEALLALLMLGAYHGINPGMGWLFAVALGMQERAGRAVARSLVPIALGHAVAIGIVVLAAGLVQKIVPLDQVKIAAALILFGFGGYRLWRHRHPRWGGMRVGFRDLTIWSFLMASAHGAGFMLLPVLFSASPAHAQHLPVAAHHSIPGAWETPLSSLTATAVHTAGYLLVMGVVAWVVYRKLGLALLKKAWVNLDLVWAVALIITGGVTLVI